MRITYTASRDVDINIYENYEYYGDGQSNYETFTEEICGIKREDNYVILMAKLILHLESYQKINLGYNEYAEAKYDAIVNVEIAIDSEILDNALNDDSYYFNKSEYTIKSISLDNIIFENITFYDSLGGVNYNSDYNEDDVYDIIKTTKINKKDQYNWTIEMR